MSNCLNKKQKTRRKSFNKQTELIPSSTNQMIIHQGGKSRLVNTRGAIKNTWESVECLLVGGNGRDD